MEARAGPHGGYQLGRGGALPPLLLDDDEAVAVAVGLRAAADGSVVGLDDATVSALAKLDQVLPAPLAARVRAVYGATAELRARDPDPLDAELLVTLAQACRAGDRLRLAYADRQGRPSERRVDPYRLVRSGPRWYLVARDVDRADWRTFRVDRVTGAVPAGGRADLSDPPDPVALVARGMALGPYPLQARVRLALGAAAAVEVIPRTVGMHTEDGPGSTIVELGGGDVAGMARYLAGLGVPVEVLAPADLREALRTYGEAIATLNE